MNFYNIGEGDVCSEIFISVYSFILIQFEEVGSGQSVCDAVYNFVLQILVYSCYSVDQGVIICVFLDIGYIGSLDKYRVKLVFGYKYYYLGSGGTVRSVIVSGSYSELKNIVNISFCILFKEVNKLYFFFF